MSARVTPKPDSVPIEGLGLGIQLTNLLRGSGITTIGRLVDLLARADDASRSVLAADAELAEMLQFPPAQKQIRTRLAVFSKIGPVPFSTLTRVETNVLNQVMEGRSNKSISAKLGVDQKTINVRLKSLHRKLGGLCAPYSD
jgi:DNA-binding NarL/FixJ family response regulator